MTVEDPIGIVGATVAGKYVVESFVARGGFSLVYRAQHVLWKQSVAIKFYVELGEVVENREAVHDAFLREGSIMADLSSTTPSVAQARDVGTHTTESGRWLPFMVMEWLDGETLADALNRDAGVRSLDQVLETLTPIARALEQAHRRGVAHRDIKPDNIFLVTGDDGVGAKLLDFGVAKVLDEPGVRATLAKTKALPTSFTPQYGAPEQFSQAYGATGPWTDVFALALVAVEMLTGRRALEGRSIVELGHSTASPTRRPTPGGRGVTLPSEVEATFTRALAIWPRDRYATAGEFWDELEHAFAAKAKSTIPARSAHRRMRTVAWWAAASAVATGVGAAVLLLGPSGNAAQSNPLRAITTNVAPATSARAMPPCPRGAVPIPAGQYFMGSDDPDSLEHERPPHAVVLRAFCIDRTEVTVADYRACSSSGRCPRAGRTVEWPKITARERAIYDPLCNETANDRLDHPVNCVTHAMASTYCAARGARLPTEAEWEYAARGPDGRTYPWGDTPPTAAHLNACGSECARWGQENRETLTTLYDDDDGFAATAPVGSFPTGTSTYGVADVAGNVWEWVGDWFGEYEPVAAENPTGPTTGDRRVIRGGAWNGGYATWLRPSFRYAADPNTRSHGIGFRCATSSVHSEGAIRTLPATTPAPAKP